MPKSKPAEPLLSVASMRLLMVLGSAALLTLLWIVPILVFFVIAIAVGVYFSSRQSDKHLSALATERSGINICQFAQCFDRRSVDPWVIRAVHEEIQSIIAGEDDCFPIMADDHLQNDLLIDEDDLDLDLAPIIAERTRRSLIGYETNPFYGKVSTVSDLVHFFNAAPRLNQ